MIVFKIDDPYNMLSKFSNRYASVLECKELSDYRWLKKIFRNKESIVECNYNTEENDNLCLDEEVDICYTGDFFRSMTSFKSKKYPDKKIFTVYIDIEDKNKDGKLRVMMNDVDGKVIDTPYLELNVSVESYYGLGETEIACINESLKTCLKHMESTERVFKHFRVGEEDLYTDIKTITNKINHIGAILNCKNDQFENCLVYVNNYCI